MCEWTCVLTIRERALNTSLLLNFFRVQALFQGMNYIFSVAATIPGFPLPMLTASYQKQILVKTNMSQYIDSVIICTYLWLICMKSSQSLCSQLRIPGALLSSRHIQVGEQLFFVSGKDRAKVSSWVEFPVCNVWNQGRCQHFWSFWRFY